MVKKRHIDMMEPDAVRLAEPYLSEDDGILNSEFVQQLATFSLAISTKRIADALEKANEPFVSLATAEEREDPTAKTNELLERIADSLAIRKGEANYRAFCDEHPDGTIDGLERSAMMLETWAAETYPASEDGKVHFGRAMMDTVAAEIRAFLANFSKVTTQDA
jgi:hypothetical protein